MLGNWADLSKSRTLVKEGVLQGWHKFKKVFYQIEPSSFNNANTTHEQRKQKKQHKKIEQYSSQDSKPAINHKKQLTKRKRETVVKSFKEKTSLCRLAFSHYKASMLFFLIQDENFNINYVLIFGDL